MIKIYKAIINYLFDDTRVRFAFKGVVRVYAILALISFFCMLATQSVLAVSVSAVNVLLHLITLFFQDRHPTKSAKYRCVLIWNMLFYTGIIFIVGYNSGYTLYLLTIAPVATSIQYTQKHAHEKSYIQPWLYTIVCTAVIIGVYSLMNVDLELFTPIVKLPVASVFNIFKVNIAVVSVVQVSILMALKTNASNYEESTRFLSTLDTLTGLRNRQNLFNELAKNKSELFCAAIIDIDDFKKFNDTYGHNNGDIVLKEVASQLADIEARNPGILSCRWGGEEFVLVGTTFDSFLILKRELELLVLSRGHTPFPIAGVEEYITITGGLTKYQHKDTLDSLISRADAFLYLGKNKGKCRIISEE